VLSETNIADLKATDIILNQQLQLSVTETEW